MVVEDGGGVKDKHNKALPYVKLGYYYIIFMLVYVILGCWNVFMLYYVVICLVDYFRLLFYVILSSGQAVRVEG